MKKINKISCLMLLGFMGLFKVSAIEMENQQHQNHLKPHTTPLIDNTSFEKKALDATTARAKEKKNTTPVKEAGAADDNADLVEILVAASDNESNSNTQDSATPLTNNEILTNNESINGSIYNSHIGSTNGSNN